MIRIGLDYRPALYSRGGIGRAIRELARSMHETGRVELHLFGHGWRSPELVETGGGKLHRTRLPGRALGALAALGVDAARLTGKPDVFLWTDYVYPPVGRGARVAMIAHDLAFHADARFHGDRQSSVLARRFANAVQRAELVFCPSNTTAQAVRAHAPEATIQTIGFGVDHVRRFNACVDRGRSAAARLLGTNAPYLVALATLEPRKNHATLLRALAHLHGRGRSLPLVCIGASGWLTDQVHRELGQQRFPCAWPGVLPDRPAFDLVAGARAMIYPSSLEGFGFPPLESLSLDVPVVAGDCTALREQLGEAALFADGTDATDLAHAIVRIVDDEQLRATTLASWAKRRERFSWARAAREYVAALESLA